MPTTTWDGWVRHANGDIWSSDNPKTARPVAYRVGDGWMVAGIRSPAELQAIAALTHPEGRDKTAAWAQVGWDVADPLEFWNVG